MCMLLILVSNPSPRRPRQQYRAHSACDCGGQYRSRVRRPIHRLCLLQTVYQAGRVEGLLRLDVPTVNLGYDQIHAGGAGIDQGEGTSIAQGQATQPVFMVYVGIRYLL